MSLTFFSQLPQFLLDGLRNEGAMVDLALAQQHGLPLTKACDTAGSRPPFGRS